MPRRSDAGGRRQRGGKANRAALREGHAAVRRPLRPGPGALPHGRDEALGAVLIGFRRREGGGRRREGGIRRRRHVGGRAERRTKTGGKVTFCKTADLAIDAADAAPDDTSGRIDVTMVNRGSTTCSATGFAGVDIKDADNTSNPVERGQAQPRVTTLGPGDAAVFNLAYGIDSTGDSLTSPTDIEVTPPNETHSVPLAWPEGAGAIKGAYTDVQVYPTHTTD
ncbi:hypothetical protein SMD44_08872 [Streptomyces alboflavus]|uniref:DUF4232 domain-containing protein n=1 Tax=Streptomyces alboflavus TaxID=67267 RepID=A0A1Z1WSH6_9ACTN|nr:DUF4232 domain-containing protein [Streptomyces alboflavus]ARX89385.1 hypothetical protein SMD44_08872 [Streptomyces alboflavus]